MARKPATEKKPAARLTVSALVEERDHLKRELAAVTAARLEDNQWAFREMNRRLEAESKLVEEKSEKAYFSGEADRWRARADNIERKLRAAEEALYACGATRDAGAYFPGAWKIPTKPVVKAARAWLPRLEETALSVIVLVLMGVLVCLPILGAVLWGPCS